MLSRDWLARVIEGDLLWQSHTASIWHGRSGPLAQVRRHWRDASGTFVVGSGTYWAQADRMRSVTEAHADHSLFSAALDAGTRMTRSSQSSRFSRSSQPLAPSLLPLAPTL